MNKICPHCRQEMIEVYPSVLVCPKEHVWEGSTYLSGVFGLAGYLAVRLRELLLKDCLTAEVSRASSATPADAPHQRADPDSPPLP
jgi:hypothetical protein